MGSVAISEVVSDRRFPFNMLAGGAHQHPAAEPPYRSSSSHSSHSNPGITHRHPASVAANVTESRSESIVAAQNVPQYSQHHQSQVASPAPTAPTSSLPHTHTTTNTPIRQTTTSQLDAAHSQSRPPTQPSSTPPPAAVHSNTAARNQTSSSNSSTQPSPTSVSTHLTVESNVNSPPCIQVRDLSHIQSLVDDEFIQNHLASPRPSRNGGDEVGLKYEISAMPVMDIIEMVAGLLTKITTTNDLQHENLHRHIPPPESTAGMSPQTSSVLAFHGKNVPSITILSYLSRIHKYCPTTYEVFLSLLVYFDRMTERVNSGPMQSLRQANSQQAVSEERPSPEGTATSSGPINEEVDSGHRSDAGHQAMPAPSSSEPRVSHENPSIPTSPSIPPDLSNETDPYNVSSFFVADSFNIHRLVIAGVTCASKFFSDVFYTNSRYAKVGGLPLTELNHLEVQFLLLNEFRLSVPVEELEAYGTMLVEFYAREVVAQRQLHPMESVPTPGQAGGL
ncbi:MAG: hypothetical protein M1837_007148 [Sclerophora amabilis]|nr:MAG: hypothetical protein M1837_007148 [Sclerophora amabilis]